MFWSSSDRRRESCSSSKRRLRSSACEHWDAIACSHMRSAWPQLTRLAQRDVQRSAYADRRCERDGDPARVRSAREARERFHVRCGQRPHRLPRRHRAGERNVVFEREGAPGVELVVRVATSRDELDRGARAAREDHEPRLGADRAQRVLETRVADVGGCGRSRERRCHLLEPQRLRRAPGRLGFGASTIELLERQPGLIGKAAQDGERRGVGVGDNGLPRDDEHQLRAGADDDGHA